MLIALDGGRCVKSNPPAGWAGCLPESAGGGPGRWFGRALGRVWCGSIHIQLPDTTVLA